MRTVEDPAGNCYLLLKRSGASSLVRDVTTGERRYLPSGKLSVVEGTTPLETAATGLPVAARKLVTAVPDESALGLLVVLEAAGGLAARAILDTTDYCEADLNGIVSELRAAGLVTTATVDGEPGYRLTDEAATVVRALQSAGASS